MSIGRICQREVDLAAAAESVVSAARRMQERRVGTLVVLDEERRPIGILTDRDVAVRVVGQDRPPGDTVVRDVMTPDPRTVREATPIEDALAVMRAHGMRRLLVVGDDDRLVGIVSLDDVLDLIVEELDALHGAVVKTSPHADRV